MIPFGLFLLKKMNGCLIAVLGRIEVVLKLDFPVWPCSPISVVMIFGVLVGICFGLIE